MKITRTQLSQIIMEELNEESGDEVRDALGLCGRYGSVGPNDRRVTDKTFGIEFFIQRLEKLRSEKDRAGMMKYLGDFFDDHIAAHLDWLDCVEWSDTQLAAYEELKEHLIDLGERYRAIHTAPQYTASRERGIQTPKQQEAAKIEDVYDWAHPDRTKLVAKLLNQLKAATTVDVESDEPIPTTWADRTMATDPSRSKAPKEPERFRVVPPKPFQEQLMEMICQELSESEGTYMDRLKGGNISAHGRNVAASQRRAAERKADYEAGYAHAQEGGKCIADKDTTWGVGVPCTGKSSWEEGFLAGREGL